MTSRERQEKMDLCRRAIAAYGERRIAPGSMCEIEYVAGRMGVSFLQASCWINEVDWADAYKECTIHG